MCEALGSTYQKEWDSLFCSKYYLENLRSSAIKGKLRNTHFRSICWKVLLECLPDDSASWIDATKKQRKHYDEILDKFHINPRKPEENLDISVNNPLSQCQKSPWNQYFLDSELRITIQQDVIRTFPEVEFFHSQHIQEVMTNVLFLFAREYPRISYKQGMHELLAPIIFVLHYDQQAYLEVSNADNLNLDVRILLNQNYIEHDAFFLFCNLMEAVEAWYTMTESPKFMSLTSAEPFSEAVSLPVNSLGLKLNNIYKNLLKRHDVELFLFLEQMEITPQIYGIRWLRLLFGREFPFHDLLIIWDAIFADGVSFDLVDYIFVAMLIAIRDLLLKSDYTSCLRHLMHYPNITDVQYVIDLAFHLRDPSRAKPENCLVQVYDFSHSQFGKESRPSFVRSGFPKNGSLKNINSRSAQIVNNADARPKSLKISTVNSCDQDFSDETPGLLESAEIVLGAESQGSNTFPCTRISQVMEGENLSFKPVEVNKSFGHVDDRNTTDKTFPYREMVPLVPANQIHRTENSFKKTRKDVAQEKNDVKALGKEISDMKLKIDYCVNQITLNISKLQEYMIGQQLLHEDEMFIALAGLKRARDILKGTVAFNEEVINDDFTNKIPSCSKEFSVNGIIGDNGNKCFDAKEDRAITNEHLPEQQVNEKSQMLLSDCDIKSFLRFNHNENCSDFINSSYVCHSNEAKLNSDMKS